MRAACSLLLGGMVAITAQAQALVDPTRPPAMDAASPGSPLAGQRLHSTLLSPGRRLAIIDGQTVALGGKVGESTVVSISETQVVLRKGNETEVLKLLPATQKANRRNEARGWREGGLQ